MKDDENKVGLGLLIVLIIILIVIFIFFKPSDKVSEVRNTSKPTNSEGMIYYDHIVQTITLQCSEGKNIEVLFFARTRNIAEVINVTYGDLKLGNLTRLLDATGFVYENNEYRFLFMNEKGTLIKKIKGSKSGELIAAECNVTSRESRD